MTVEIGISINNESRIGIVHYPYFDVNNDKKKFQPTTFFGTVEHGMYRLDLPDHIKIGTDEYKLRHANYIEPLKALKANDDRASFFIGHTAGYSRVVMSLF